MHVINLKKIFNCLRRVFIHVNVFQACIHNTCKKNLKCCVVCNLIFRCIFQINRFERRESISFFFDAFYSGRLQSNICSNEHACDVSSI